MSFGSILSGAAALAADVSPIGAFNAVANKVSGNKVGFDPTPDFSATNVTSGAIDKAINAGAPSYSPPAIAHGTFAASQPTPQGSAVAGDTTGGAGGGYGSGYATNASTGIIPGIFDQTVNNLQGQYDALPQYQQLDQNSVYDQYNPQLSALQTQHATGRANLDLAQQQLDTQRTQGLRNLGNSLRGALNGYQNQIGVMGAGNSSAAPLIGYALTQQGNRQMGDMNANYGLQQTGINQQSNDLEANFKNQMDSLEGWKQSQLNNIASNYARQQQALQQAISQARGQEATYLAMYGQTALANEAISQMQALQSQYGDAAAQLHAQLGNAYAPQADISKYTGAPTINPINPGSLTPLSFQANNVAPDNTAAAASLVKRPDQAPNSNFGF